MKPVFFAFAGNERFTAAIADALACGTGQLELRRFPDGESYLRYLTDVACRDVVLVCTLDRPDDKAIALYLAARTARELGARRIGLVAPYLAYMRQDAKFRTGEGITSAHFAQFVCGFADWLITVDPHLHRHRSLDVIYTIPSTVVHAAPVISEWISRNVTNPFVIGPDRESEQWVAEVAHAAGCPYLVQQKVRHGDRDVEISLLEPSVLRGHTPVIVDDIVSTARTMIAAAAHLHEAGLQPPVCIAAHPVFAGDSYAALRAAGVQQVVSCNTIAHESNEIDVSGLTADAIAPFLTRG